MLPAYCEIIFLLHLNIFYYFNEINDCRENKPFNHCNDIHTGHSPFHTIKILWAHTPLGITYSSDYKNTYTGWFTMHAYHSCFFKYYELI